MSTRWQPLEYIIYGFAIHPLNAQAYSRISSANNIPWEAFGDHVIPNIADIEVGDEVYAFEQYGEQSNVWYRGYVVSTSKGPIIQGQMHDPMSINGVGSSTSTTGTTAEEPQVSIAIFPASYIHIRDELPDAEGRLTEIYHRLHQNVPNGHSPSHLDRYGMETLREEDEFRSQVIDNTVNHSQHNALQSPRSPRSAQSPPTTMSLSAPMQQMQGALDTPHSPSPLSEKPVPPRPSLKSGDDTASGQTQPLVDEIASALREWHSLLFTYLTRRDYKLFNAVRQHLEALHLGRRQLLSETLSADETAALRKDCVARLVRGNIAQGLDVIVRHPTWGGLVTVDVEGDIDNRSWLSAVRMYAMQVSLAYMDELQADYGLIPRTCALHNTTDPSSPEVSDPTQSPSLTTTAGGFFTHRRAASERRPSHQTSAVSSPGVPPPAPSQPTSNSSIKFFHVYFELRAFVASPCSPGETAEVYFSLYNKSASQFLTEEFCAVLNHNGVLARDNMAKVRTLFRDLGSQDVQDSIYLVCRIVRNGSMKLGLSPTSTAYPKSPSQDIKSAYLDEFGVGDGSGMVRRPFGCAVSELTQLAKVSAGGTDVAREHTMPIFVPVNEAAYSTLHQDLIASRTKEFEKSPRAEMLAVTIKVFHGEASKIIKENPSLLQDVPNTYRLGFPDVVFPGDVRNEVYIKLWSGEFNSSTTSTGSAMRLRKSVGGSPSNIQVTVEVRTPSGHTVEDAICLGTGEPPLTHFNSMVFYRNNIPTYGELVKLTIPASIMPECHLFFTFRHRSSKEKSGTSGTSQGSLPSHAGGGDSVSTSDRPFAFAYLPLFPDKQAFLEDGSHTLVLYKADKLTSFNVKDYFNAPPVVKPRQRPESLPIPSSLSKTAVPSRDSFTIRSFLCSTTFTSNSVLLGLLNWEKLNDKDEILTALSQFTFVGEMEIVKFLRDIFDSLFAILVSSINQNNEMDDLVFNALVTVLGIVQDRRFHNFQPVLDVYIEKHFTSAAAHNRMIRSINRLLGNAAAAETASKLRAALKVWHYIFKFIVKARELQKAKEASLGTLAAEHLEAQFKKEVWGHLNEVNKLMSTSIPSSIIGTQTIALQHFTTILPELGEVFSKVELVTVVTSFANAANMLGTKGVGKIGIWKLMMYLQLVQGFLFDDQSSRGLLLESVVSWIKPCFGRYDEYLHVAQEDGEAVKDNSRVVWLEGIRLCVTIVAVMLDKLNKCLVDPAITDDRRAFRQEQENVEYLLSLLPRLLDSYREIKSPAMLHALSRHRSPATTASPIPVIFPGSYPFPIVASSANAPRRSVSGPVQSHQGFYQSTAEKSPSFNPGLADTAMTLLVLILSAPRKHLVGFFESFLDIEGKDNLGRLLMNYFQVTSSILNNEAFPLSWLNVNILAHKVVMKMSEPIAFVMLRDFVPQEVTTDETETGLARMEEFDINLWKESFLLLLKLLSSDQLVIEEFSPQKRRAVWRLANDIRGEGAAILLRLWEALGWPEAMSAQAGAVTRYGRYQVNLISLVEQVLNICLSHHDQLRSNAVLILYSMIVSEYHHSGNFNEIQTELVNKLDKLFMSETRGDDISRAFFISQLRRLFDSSTLDENLKLGVGEFLDSVDQFLGLLLSVRELPEGEEYQDDRVIATLRLMNFIRQIGRDEIYIKYVHQLVNMHLQSQNYVEAALTLKLHADLHEWNLNSFCDPMPGLGLPRQSQFVRKETLCLLILDYLGKGKAWESGVEICKELAYQHSEVTFNYQRLSEILMHQATLLEHIVTDQRYYSEYFRVAFYGNFPAALRDRHFIYRGYEWEKLGAFCERMLNKHPGARLLKHADKPSDEIRFGSLQWIHCSSVTPEPDRTLSIFTNPEVPEAVRKYYEHSAINVFSRTQQVSRSGSEHPDFSDTWHEKTFYKTEESFPTVLRRSEIIEVHAIETSPIENALNDVETRTRELVVLEMKYSALAQTEASVVTNPLAAALNAVVDAPEDTGIPMYRHVFFGPDYLAENPDHVELVHQLLLAIEEQVRVIGRCLALHGSLCSPEMRSFHSILERFFRKNFQDEIERLDLEASTHQYPSPMSSRPPEDQHQLNEYEQPLSPLSPMSSGGHQRMESFSFDPRARRDFGDYGGGRNVQTPLQRNLAHLARHGITGVSSGPGERSTLASEPRSDSPDFGTGNFVNVGPAGLSGVNGRETISSGRSIGFGTSKISRKFGSFARRQRSDAI